MSASDRISIRPMCFGAYVRALYNDRSCGTCMSAEDCMNNAFIDSDKRPDEQPIKRRAPDFLQAALGHMEDRAKTYDNPLGERSMGRTVTAFNVMTGRTITEEEGWLFMLLLKAVRSQQGGYRADSYEDGAAYFGLMGEAAAMERKS